MKLETLNDRIAKAEERVTKKQNTIEKKVALIAKKESKLNSVSGDERFWLECDIEHLKEDIERLGKEIEETKKQLEKYNTQMSGAEEQEKMLKELPELFNSLRDELVERWDAYDKEHRDFLKKQYSNLGYSAFVKKYHYAAYEEMYVTDEKIHNSNMNAAKALIIDLIYRVKSRVGEITDWSGIRATAGTYGYTVLNGFVKGTQGRCVVESIGAGGYNIQRYHIRVLVKECN